MIFEEIPVLRRRLEDEAESLVLGAATEVRSTFIADYYFRRLRRYFEAPRNYWRHVFRAATPRQALLTEIDARDRYLNDKERAIMRQIRDLVKRKESLDCQYALQATLKYWLFVHVPLTYGLMAFAAPHVLIIYAFSEVIR